MRNRLLLASVFLATTFQVLSAHTVSVDHAQDVPDTEPTMSSGIETQHFSDGVLKVDKTGKGAVLCVWGIYEAIRAVARECHNGQDATFQTELDKSLHRIDAFIIKHSRPHATEAQLASRRAEGLAELKSLGGLCKGDAEKMYEALHSQGAAALRVNTDQLLSIPREPVMAPCL